MRHTENRRHNRNNIHIILGQKAPETRHAIAHEALSGHVKCQVSRSSEMACSVSLTHGGIYILSQSERI